VIYGAADKTLGESNLGRFTMTVRGTVTGMAGAYRFAFVDRAWLGDQAGVPNAASSIALHLDDHDSAREVAAAIRAKRSDVAAFAWQDEEAGFASYIEAKRLISRVSYAMVIAAIAIPTWALLYIQVLRRRRELAILRAIGFLRRELFAICVLQAVAIGVIGCALGAALGFGLIRYFDSNPLFAWESLTVRPVADLASFAVPAIVILATAVIAVLHPAYRASRVDPAPALRRIE
jgi:ABC-type lipoprotein release transport system permease subunit